MKTKTFAYAISAAFICNLWSVSVFAGGLYKCKDADGNVTFSDIACPGAAARSVKINVPSAEPSTPNPIDYWSIESQAGRLDEKKAREQAERDAHRLIEDQRDREREQQRQAESMREEATGAQQVSAARQPLLTYEMALLLALRDAGYHRYDNLNKLQKERVHAEMSKYHYLPKSRDLGGAQADDEEIPAGIEQAHREKEQRARDVEQTYRTEKRPRSSFRPPPMPRPRAGRMA